ncbi:DUF2780 domain-containing protein [Paraglaciecola aquimarina]|uniref:DUF2780 domain-containing protein n=1 Tax=Paraglaciecola aquimarina TaxID=1235557 RepID=A0ABU3SWR2_9ALTE|nr:DUF2780 domain-containing protein [Paraglaciecola aquimarina]MDU0354428.1 DUF2780 domain-containing protein [Paraglaciecola aquimarina]
MLNLLGITQSQATGSLGSIFEYAKNNITEEQVSSLSNSLPGLDSLLSAAPSLSGSSSADNANSLGGLLGKAAEYSDSLSAIAGLQQQFESLGLDTEHDKPSHSKRLPLFRYGTRQASKSAITTRFSFS